MTYYVVLAFVRNDGGEEELIAEAEEGEGRGTDGRAGEVGHEADGLGVGARRGREGERGGDEGAGKWAQGTVGTSHPDGYAGMRDGLRAAADLVGRG